MKFDKYDVVFKELPGEISLAFSISGCKNNCKGCHSSHLMEDIGTELTNDVLFEIVEHYEQYVTTVLFLGEGTKEEMADILVYIKKTWSHLKTAVYSGSDILRNYIYLVDYFKVGRYIEELGGLDKVTTNQRLYRVNSNDVEDITKEMQRG